MLVEHQCVPMTLAVRVLCLTPGTHDEAGTVPRSIRHQLQSARMKKTGIIVEKWTIDELCGCDDDSRPPCCHVTFMRLRPAEMASVCAYTPPSVRAISGYSMRGVQSIFLL